MRQNLSEIALNKSSLIMIFGSPKTGKTTSSASLANLLIKKLSIEGTIWYFDFDGGDAIQPFIRHLDPEVAQRVIRYFYAPKGGDKVGATEFRPRGQGRDIFLDFLSDFNRVYDLIDQDTGRWKTKKEHEAPCLIIYDSMTSLQDIILDFVLCMVGHDLGAPKTDSRSDYGKQMSKIVEIVESAKSVPCSHVFIAHEKVTQNELTSELRIDPDFTGKLAAEISAYFGTVLYSKTRKNGQKIDYLWQTMSDGWIKSVGARPKDNLPLEMPQDFELLL